MNILTGFVTVKLQNGNPQHVGSSHMQNHSCSFAQGPKGKIHA